ncbi:MAG: 3-deoxy-7-phosphoheptulonate synthase [Candidatus Dasytiphilus stammeri]
MQKIENLNKNIVKTKWVPTPEEIKNIYPCHNDLKTQIYTSRKFITNIIKGNDNRFLLICGPCSIHDYMAALDYANRLKNIADKFKDKLYIVMRVFLEKPRSITGWKGFINDPYINNSFDIEYGLRTARQLLLEIVKLGLPIATEILNIYTTQYLADLLSWVAIGARTVESQPHREIASGLSMPIGFKNSTNGNYYTAINAMVASSKSHHFLGINNNGRICLWETSGNHNGHMILRGGNGKSNYKHEIITKCQIAMKEAGLHPALMIDCSHDNSKKQYLIQPKIAKYVVKQRIKGNKAIIGLMIESNINEGNQSFELPDSAKRYGVSLTDACINWQTTENLIKDIYQELLVKDGII